MGSEDSGEQCQRRTAASCTVGATLQTRLPRRAAPWFATLTDAVRPSAAQKAKYKAHEFGSCPRTLCEKQTVLPTGVSDTASLRCASRAQPHVPFRTSGARRKARRSLSTAFVAGVRSGENPMKLYCSKCQELYDYNVPGGNYIDGAFFGTTFPHLFMQTFHELRPTPSTAQYIPRVFGFKVHKAPEAQAAPLAREEWPKRPKNEPVSDWDS